MSVRLRQAVLCASDLDATCAELEQHLGVRDPFHDPEVGWFGLRNAVYCIGDQFLEVVSPVKDDSAGARHLARRGGDSGYMLMFQVRDIDEFRLRAHDAGVRRVFDIDADDIAESHLHPADMGGAIVAITKPDPVGSWRWGGEGWAQRSVKGSIVSATVEGADVARWGTVLGAGRPVRHEDGDRGFVELVVSLPALQEPVTIAGVRFTPVPIG